MVGSDRRATYLYALGFVLLAVACGILYYLASDVARRDALRQLTADMEFRAEAMQSWLNAKSQTLDVLRLTLEESVGDDPLSSRNLNAYKRDPDLSNVIYGDMNGKIITGLPAAPFPRDPTLEDEWFRLATERTESGSVIGPFSPSPNGPAQIFTIAAPLRYSNGTMRGALAFVIPQSTVAAVAQKMPSEGKKVLIITSDQKIIVPLDPTGRAASFQSQPAAAQLQAQARDARKGTIEISLDGTPHIFAYTSLRGTNWIFALHAPKDALLSGLAPLQNLFLFFCAGTALCIGGLMLRLRKHGSYKNLSELDQLTQIGNRTAYEQTFKNLRRKADFPVALLICDMDNLKKINDAFGHESGDRQIQRTVSVMRGCLRGDDYIFRLGGDEFAILLLGTVARTATLLVRRITRALEDNSLAHPNRPPLELSIGMAFALDTEELESLYRRADEAMYEQKMARKGQATSHKL